MTCRMFQFRETVPHEVDFLEKVIGMIESTSHPDLRCYMVDQLVSARNVDQLVAAVELVSEVAARRVK